MNGRVFVAALCAALAVDPDAHAVARMVLVGCAVLLAALGMRDAIADLFEDEEGE